MQGHKISYKPNGQLADHEDTSTDLRNTGVRVQLPTPAF